MNNKVFKANPKNLTDAIDIIITNLDEKDIKHIKENKDSIGWETHHFLGRHLRNEWGLWEDKTELSKNLWNECKLWHGDDRSGLIIDCVIRTICDQPLKIKEKVKKYHDHWWKYSKVKPGERPNE